MWSPQWLQFLACFRNPLVLILLAASGRSAVTGDIVELIVGDLIPTGARLLDNRDLFVNQALLTGKPYSAEEQASDAALEAEARPEHRTRCLPAPP